MGYVPYVSSSLDFLIQRPPGQLVADLVTDALFAEKMLEIIALNLPSAAILGITQADVTILAMMLVPDSRRLMGTPESLLAGAQQDHSEERRLQETGTIRIDYKVRLQDEASVYQLRDELVMKQTLFKQQLKASMESIDGVELTVVEITIGKSQKLEGYEIEIKTPEE